MTPRPGVRAVAVTALLASAGCSHLMAPRAAGAVPCAELARLYTPGEVRADVDWLFARIEDAHPSPYTVTSKPEMARHRAQLIGDLSRPLPRGAFGPALSRLVARLGDGHTGVWTPEEVWCHLGAGGRLFPLRLDWDGERVIVDAQRPFFSQGGIADPAAGAEILAINGYPARPMFERMTEQQSGELPAWRRGQVEAELAVHLYFNGILAPFRVRYRPPGGQPREVTLEGARVERPARSPARVPATYRELPSRIGYIDFSRLDRDLSGALASFLERTFTEIRRREVRGLIVDLRRNGGGAEALGGMLLDHVTDRPYTFHGAVVRKASRTWREGLAGQAPWWVPIGLMVRLLAPADLVEAWRSPDGRVLTFKDAALHRPPPNPLRFHGPVCFLIGPRTFSSAGGLANAIADFKLATLMGEATGQAVNAYGEAILIRLPRTRILASISTSQLVRANGDATTRGPVQPDIEVRQPPTHAGDAVLERAQAWVLEQRPAGSRGSCATSRASVRSLRPACG